MKVRKKQGLLFVQEVSQPPNLNLKSTQVHMLTDMRSKFVRERLKDWMERNIVQEHIVKNTKEKITSLFFLPHTMSFKKKPYICQVKHIETK